jgi:hypothetical protein
MEEEIHGFEDSGAEGLARGVVAAVAVSGIRLGLKGSQKTRQDHERNCCFVNS